MPLFLAHSARNPHPLLLAGVSLLTLALGAGALWGALHWYEHKGYVRLEQELAQYHAKRVALTDPTLVYARSPAERRAADIAEALGGSWELVGETGSMEPALHGGDLLILQPVPIETVRVGDIIVFRMLLDERGEAVWRRIVHRVVAIEACASAQGAPSLVGTSECTVLRTQGDANAKRDAARVRVGEFEGVIVARVDTRTAAVSFFDKARAVQP